MHNQKFISDEINKTQKVFDDINGYSLDIEQRKSIITDEDSCLIVAGAGSGKTLTMIGKIKYLIECKGVKPDEILCISFTNFTTISLKKAINKSLKYNINIFTFHKIGLKIIKSKYKKVNICKDNYLDCIFYEFMKNDLFLDKILIEKILKNYFVVKIMSNEIIYDCLVRELYHTTISFINMFKSNNYSYTKFEDIKFKIMKIKNKLEKNKLLIILEIIKKIYDKYQLYLKENNLIDFNDMINLATNLIKNNEVKLNYKYIIVDEYQDTSICRYNLIKSIKDSCGSKLVAVGDDFQSIYRFTGCDVNMFLNFQNYFPYSKIMYLTNTYRNSQELINIASKFIVKNKYQIKKKLFSNKNLSKPVKIYFYKDKSEISNLFLNINDNQIFVLGRNNSDVNYFDNCDFKINDNKIKFLKNKNMDITFMTVHKSKGLESSTVVIVNLENKTLGFPSKCENHLLIKFLCNMKELYPFDEERRLFYVALTRTKGNVFLFVSRKNPSIFVLEIIRENKKLIEFIN